MTESVWNNNRGNSRLFNVADGRMLLNGGKNCELVNGGHRSHLHNSGVSTKIINSGDGSYITNTGVYSKIINKGNYVHIANAADFVAIISEGLFNQIVSMGYRVSARMNGGNTLGINLGIEGRMMGKVGDWMVMVEEEKDYKPICVKSAIIDGKKIKEDIWYILEN